MAYDFSSLLKGTKDTLEWLTKEFSGIRTGRAAPALLDSVRVEVYGSTMTLPQVASVSIEDARTLRISPWDTSTIKAVEKAIIDANIGVSPAVDERGLRVMFPELTSERRVQLMKLVKEKLEQAKIAIRKARDDAWNEIQKKEKEGDISEDEKFRAKDDMQKIVDKGNADLDDLYKKKETELNQ